MPEYLQVLKGRFGETADLTFESAYYIAIDLGTPLASQNEFKYSQVIHRWHKVRGAGFLGKRRRKGIEPASLRSEPLMSLQIFP